MELAHEQLDTLAEQVSQGISMEKLLEEAPFQEADITILVKWDIFSYLHYAWDAFFYMDEARKAMGDLIGDYHLLKTTVRDINRDEIYDRRSNAILNGDSKAMIYDSLQEKLARH